MLGRILFLFCAFYAICLTQQNVPNFLGAVSNIFVIGAGALHFGTGPGPLRYVRLCIVRANAGGRAGHNFHAFVILAIAS